MFCKGQSTLSSVVMESAWELQRNEVLVDVFLQPSSYKSEMKHTVMMKKNILYTEQGFPGHKLILASASPFLKQLFEEHYNDHKEKLVYVLLPETSALALHHVLLFIYTSTLNIPPYLFDDVFALCKVLEISAALKFLDDKLKPNNENVLLDKDEIYPYEMLECLPAKIDLCFNSNMQALSVNNREINNDTNSLLFTSQAPTDDSYRYFSDSDHQIDYSRSITNDNISNLACKLQLDNCKSSILELQKENNLSQDPNVIRNTKLINLSKKSLQSNSSTEQKICDFSSSSHPKILSTRSFYLPVSRSLQTIKSTAALFHNAASDPVESGFQKPNMIVSSSLLNTLNILEDKKLLPLIYSKDALMKNSATNLNDSPLRLVTNRNIKNKPCNLFQEKQTSNILPVKTYGFPRPNLLHSINFKPAQIQNSTHSTSELIHDSQEKRKSAALHLGCTSPLSELVLLTNVDVNKISNSCQSVRQSKAKNEIPSANLENKTSSLNSYSNFKEESICFDPPEINLNLTHCQEEEERKLQVLLKECEGLDTGTRIPKDNTVNYLDSVLKFDFPEEPVPDLNANVDQWMQGDSTYIKVKTSDMTDILSNSLKQVKGKHRDCKVCGKTFARSNDCHNHELRHQKATLPCTMCKKKFKLKKDLDAHMKIHLKVRYVECEKCLKKLTTTRNLRLHLIRFHSADIKFHECCFCDKKFRKVVSLQVHVNSIHKPVAEWAYNCNICQKKFSDKSILKSHISAHHKKADYSCEECNLKFTRYRLYWYHKKIHKNSFKCELCSATYSNFKDYSKHKLIHKNKHSKRFLCQLCYDIFKSKISYEKHMKASHNVLNSSSTSIAHTDTLSVSKPVSYLPNNILQTSEINTCDAIDKEKSNSTISNPDFINSSLQLYFVKPYTDNFENTNRCNNEVSRFNIKQYEELPVKATYFTQDFKSKTSNILNMPFNYKINDYGIKESNSIQSSKPIPVAIKLRKVPKKVGGVKGKFLGAQTLKK